MNIKHLLMTLSTSVLLTFPAQAALQSSADFQPGHSIGVGLFGLSYDYGFDPISVGTVISSGTDISFLSSYSKPRLKVGLRSVWRFWEQNDLAAGVIAGVQYDPGVPGDRAFLTPDAGLSLTYHLRDFALALRINVTLTASPRNMGLFYSSNGQSRGNFFQQLTLGPNTSLELAYQPMENLEITLGGGTFLGMRLTF